MRRPPPVLVFLSVLLLALGTTGGALMSLLRPQIQDYASARIFAAREAHSLSGSRDYDAEIVREIVFSIEAALSFFHTHGEGGGLILLFAATLVASLVAPRRLRLGLFWLLGLSSLFPLGYLAQSALILVYGRDRGVALAERLLLIPFGSSAILGLALLGGAVGVLFISGRARGRRPPVSEPATDIPEARLAAEGWQRPPRPIVLAAALLIAMAELGGAAMGRFKPEIDAFTAARVLERPDVHGLVGVSDVDTEITEQVRVRLDSGLRLFHLHGEGVGLMILALGLVLASARTSAWLRRALSVLVTVGGFGFPMGYLLWSALMPLVGVGPARTVSAVGVLIPFGGALLVSVWGVTVLAGRDVVAARARGLGHGPHERARGLRPPPLTLVLAAVLLFVLAGVGGGAMVGFKIDLDRARRAAVEARPLVHGLVGVRSIDGPVVDTLLSRADFALRLFHLHGTGTALVMLAAGLMVENFTAPRLLRGMLHTLLAVGGFLYPFGYLAWSALIPVLGLQPSRELAEWVLWVPFGGAVLLSTALLALALATQLLVAVEPRRRP